MRAFYEPRTIVLRGEEQRLRALAAIQHLPLDPESPLQLVISEYKPPRRLDQNALMWAGPLKDMEEQAYLEQRRYSADVWHEYFKEQFLPEEFDPELCRAGYVKYKEAPDDKRMMVGSTTMLTKKGFSIYLEQIFAFGANLGVQFSANPNEVQP